VLCAYVERAFNTGPHVYYVSSFFGRPFFLPTVSATSSALTTALKPEGLTAPTGMVRAFRRILAPTCLERLSFREILGSVGKSRFYKSTSRPFRAHPRRIPANNGPKKLYTRPALKSGLGTKQFSRRALGRVSISCEAQKLPSLRFYRTCNEQAGSQCGVSITATRSRLQQMMPFIKVSPICLRHQWQRRFPEQKLISEFWKKKHI
jgi:hypothetical protein